MSNFLKEGSGQDSSTIKVKAVLSGTYVWAIIAGGLGFAGYTGDYGVMFWVVYTALFIPSWVVTIKWAHGVMESMDG